MHPTSVARILLTYTQDQAAILAAPLYDTVDAAHFTLNQIALSFNPGVQWIMYGVTRVDSRLESFKKLQLSNYETMLKLLEVKDERILYVKLANRIECTTCARSRGILPWLRSKE